MIVNPLRIVTIMIGISLMLIGIAMVPSSFDTTTHIDTTGLVADATEEFTMGDVSFPANSWVLNLKIGIVLKQNETTSFASTVLIEIMNTNGTTCYTNDIGVSRRS